MTIKRLSLKQSMNKNVQAIMPQEDERFGFENKLISYLETLQTKQAESEEYQKLDFPIFKIASSKEFYQH